MEKAMAFLILATVVLVLAAVGWRLWTTRNIRNDV